MQIEKKEMDQAKENLFEVSRHKPKSKSQSRKPITPFMESEHSSNTTSYSGMLQELGIDVVG